MLKTILSISGKPGLYKLVSQGKNMLIVESLADKKRFPAYGNEKDYFFWAISPCIQIRKMFL